MSAKRTPFYDLHISLKAKMTDFVGFEMPVQYEHGITAEHQAVRNGVGVFDVSHMGEFEITGPRLLQRLRRPQQSRSRRTRTRQCVERTSSIRTCGPQWARRASPQRAPPRFGITSLIAAA